MQNKRSRSLPVTDHAVLRWLERHGFVDVEAVRRQIFVECKSALRSGASKLKTNDTEYRIQGGVVVTVITRRNPHRKRSK